MKRVALVFFFAVASASASEAAKNHSGGAGCESAKAAKATDESPAATAAKPDARARPNATPRRIPYHMLMIH